MIQRMISRMFIVFALGVVLLSAQTCGKDCCNPEIHHCCSSKCCVRAERPYCCGSLEHPGCCLAEFPVCCVPQMYGCCKATHPVCCPPDGCCPAGTRCGPPGLCLRSLNGKDILIPSMSSTSSHTGLEQVLELNRSTIQACQHDLVLKNLDQNGERVVEGSTVFIDQQGIFPNLLASVCSQKPLKWHLTIRFPPWSTEKTSTESNWNIRESMGKDIAGGDARLQLKIDTSEISIQFKIRGRNPTHQMINTMICDSPWFAKRIARHESNVVCEGPGPRQFKEDGLPCIGKEIPHGYGIFQITSAPTMHGLGRVI